MASKSHKLCSQPDFDARRLPDTYLSRKSASVFGDEVLKFTMEKVYNSLHSGDVKGKTLLDISMGFAVHHLYPASEFFEEIVILKFGKECVTEVNKWLHDRTGACDWSHIAPIMKEIEAESDHQEEREVKLKKAVTQVIECDINKEHLIDPLVVPQADCLISFALVESISKNTEDYIKYLRKFFKFLKPKGHLLLLGVVNGSYYMVGDKRYNVFTYNENFVQEALIREGFRIDQSEFLERKAKSDLLDYEGLVFVKAQKEQNI